MPELPEVETVAAQLRSRVVGRTILACRLWTPGMVRHPSPDAFVLRLAGRRIEAVTRRGKYLLHRLSGCGGELLVVHLGMTGTWTCVPAEAPEPGHLHLVLELDDGCQLRYRDTRRFGRLLLGAEADLLAAGVLPRLGPEPLDPAFTPEALHRLLRGRRAPLKALLLDQRVVAGLGNIYADEACFRAGLRPDRPGGSLSRRSAARLHDALREVLLEAIANGGSSVDDYRDARGEPGRQQERLLVYGRAGRPCLRCGRRLAVIRLAGRSTVFCRRCQR
ncbi:MAG TPA: bifunctional DNA-formamidopyrimidine glycosylase/DNA-(apurinic or apyrimidinic site) lyase [Candidatus Dormibacteraeota bacterium]|nr:bifunctional DNA-formamidopyrimidine glycosylase/DNA-(apurinic or apyrimidinic site) lyase [Candidatus Dormibacteraeota bacterium]